MSRQKAGKFNAEALLAGWKAEDIKHEEDINRYTATVTRGEEKLVLWWDNNQMLECPIYTLGAYEMRPRNMAAARRMLTAKPDLSKAYQKARKIAKGTDAEGQAIPIVRHELPFDIHEDSDSTILKALRGSRIVYLNGLTQAAQVTHIPKLKNLDLQNVFFLSESVDGKAFVSFMDELGMFRAVHLENILQVS